MKQANTFAFHARTVRQTEKARLVEVTILEADPVGTGFVELETEVWIPKSKMRLVEGDGPLDRWEVPMWIARDRGLVEGTLSGRFTRYKEAM